MKLEDDQIVEALRNAGVPYKFCNPKHSLSEYGEFGKSLREWEKGGVRNLFIVGTSPIAFYGFCTLARNLILDAVAAKIIGLPDLVESIGVPEYREELDRIQALFIVGFYKHGMRKSPFSEDVGDRIEWFLTKRLQSDRSTIFLATNTPDSCDWWTPYLRGMIEDSLPTQPLKV
jgi:hypothetical protein